MPAGDFNEVAAAFPDPFRLFYRDSVESTNDEARALGKAGATDGLVILAERQTAGRGRRGAAWFSPPGESLAFSILIRPEEPKALWPRLALATGLAVAEGIESLGVSAGIKWPNDVWIGGKKVCGILVEAGQDFVVVGIGINVRASAFPPEVAAIATSLHLESTWNPGLPETLAAIISRFAMRRRQIGAGFGEVIRGVNERCVLGGKRVSLVLPDGKRTGVVEGIAPGGELLLRDASGALLPLIQADEVRILGD